MSSLAYSASKPAEAGVVGVAQFGFPALYRPSLNVKLEDGRIPLWPETISVYQFLGYCLLVICALLALRVLAAVFRTGP